MLTPEYLFHVTEGAEKITSDMHKNIMDMIVERIMVRIGRGEDYLLTATDRWQIQVLQESGYLLEDIQKEIAYKTKKQERELKSAFEEAGIKAIERDDAIYRAVGLSPTPLLQSPALLRILERDYNVTCGESIKQNGEPISGTEMDYTVATANVYQNVGATTLIAVPAGSSVTISVGNVGTVIE